MTRTPPTMDAPAYLVTATEAQFQKVVVEVAMTYGWHVQVQRNSIANQFMLDLILLRNGVGIVAELKREGGTLTPRQRQMVEALRERGVPTFIWRPSDWPAIERTLRRDEP